MIEFNLIPTAIQLRQQRRVWIVRWTSGVLVTLLLVAIPTTADWMRNDRKSRLLADRAAIQDELLKAAARVEALRSESAALSIDLDRARAFRAKRSWSGLLRAIAGAKPEGVWLSEVSTFPPSPAGGTATGDSASADGSGAPVEIEAPRQLDLSGWALTPELPWQYASNLKDLQLFETVHLRSTTSDRIAQITAIRFELTLTW